MSIKTKTKDMLLTMTAVHQNCCELFDYSFGKRVIDVRKREYLPMRPFEKLAMGNVLRKSLE
jgi:hypothetical protein